MAQSRLRQPLTNPAEPGIPKHGPKKRNARGYATAATLLLADIAFLSIAALAGSLLEANLVTGSGMAAEATIALWVPVAFVSAAALSMMVIDSQQARQRGFSLREWAQVIAAVSLASLIAWGVSEVISPGILSLEVAAAVWALAVLILPVGRVIARQALYARGISSKRVVVVGDVDQAMPVIEQLNKNGAQYRVAGAVLPTDGHGNGRLSVAGGKDLSNGSTPGLSSLPQVMRDTQATEVLIAVSNAQSASVKEEVRKTAPAGSTVHLAVTPLAVEEAGPAKPSEKNGSVPAVRRAGPDMPWQYEKVKRGFDVAAALIILILASPLMAMLAIAVKLDSNGPVFFKQPRIGRNAKQFGMYKFRSMRVNAEAMLPELMKQNEASGAMFKMKNDPRITRVGKVIRKLSLDELPQLFNVLNGTMSLVGPRPPLPREVAVYEDEHYQRLGGVPGITGLWQVKRGPVLDFNEMMTYDLEYLRTWSLKLDIIIMLKTIPVVITGRGAY